jgi:sterol desaturase/sphingolipid hydroxylase (fatty acid hydroxylase superfamily)
VIPWGVYDVKAHDVHHRIPQSNYGQYTVLWDRLLGSFRPYA